MPVLFSWTVELNSIAECWTSDAVHQAQVILFRLYGEDLLNLENRNGRKVRVALPPCRMFTMLSLTSTCNRPRNHFCGLCCYLCWTSCHSSNSQNSGSRTHFQICQSWRFRVPSCRLPLGWVQRKVSTHWAACHDPWEWRNWHGPSIWGSKSRSETSRSMLSIWVCDLLAVLPVLCFIGSVLDFSLFQKHL